MYKLILSQSRTAARKELLDQANRPDECEKLYEESLWCLYALQDDLLQTDNPFMEEDRTTVQTCMLFRQGSTAEADDCFCLQGSNELNSASFDAAFAWA